jgi:hypothetical protein
MVAKSKLLFDFLVCICWIQVHIFTKSILESRLEMEVYDSMPLHHKPRPATRCKPTSYNAKCKCNIQVLINQLFFFYAGCGDRNHLPNIIFMFPTQEF